MIQKEFDEIMNGQGGGMGIGKGNKCGMGNGNGCCMKTGNKN